MSGHDYFTAGTQGRLEKLQRRNATRRFAAAFVLLVLCGLTLGATLTSSPALFIRDVRVTGAVDLLPDEVTQIRQAVALPPGCNIINSPRRAVASGLARLPFLRAATDHIRSPWRLEYRVYPRRPAAVVVAAAGPYEIDRGGTVIRAARPSLDLPTIRLAAPMSVVVGRRLASGALSAALSICDLRNGSPRVPVGEVVVDGQDNICLNTVAKRPLTVRMGNASGVVARLPRLRRIFELDPGIGAQFVALDLSSMSAPYGELPHAASRPAPPPVPVASTGD